MCSLFRNKYRNESFRLAGHDYSSGGAYFVTICTHRMLSYFGYISCGKMILSELGIVANNFWHDLPDHFAFISLDEFVIMPNHIHGIVIIEPPTAVRTLHATSRQQPATSQQQPATNPVGTLPATSLHQSTTSIQKTKNEFMSAISPKSGSLPTVIRSYKSAVSKYVHLIDHDFSWQPRYYDHLIRSDKEMDRIRKYIINNPVNWNNH